MNADRLLLRKISKGYLVFYSVIFLLNMLVLPPVVSFLKESDSPWSALAFQLLGVFLGTPFVLGMLFIIPAVCALLFLKADQQPAEPESQELDGLPTRSLINKIASWCLYLAGFIFVVGFIFTAALHIFLCSMREGECAPVGLFLGVLVAPTCFFLFLVSGVLYTADHIIKKKG